ncbi:MAG: phosphatase PAP2 family protein [Phycisphaeraceae bacterium]|nr:MAG: phosphatase PAP2 family protein [Phycisphaeraceae bacterium]
MSSSHARTNQASGGGGHPADADSIEPERGSRRRALIWAGLLAAAGLACIPFDGPISQAAANLRDHVVGGDIKRELESLQQYGQGAITLLVAWAIWLGDPGKRRRLLDWLLAVALAAVVTMPMKMLIGRPRPKFDDPGYFLGPFGAYPLGHDVGVRHAWEFWAGISSDLWSMPSSHTVYAVVMSVFLASVYPRLRPLAVLMAVVVGVSRVLFGAHYPSDVLVGAALGLAVAAPVMGRYRRPTGANA